MKAALYYGHKDIRVQQRPEPAVHPGHVKIKVAWAGICGTDRHEYMGPVFIPTLKPHRLSGRMAPLIMGHECSGTIIEIGHGVEGWTVGDRVTVSGNLTCGECKWCREGRLNICERLGFYGISTDGCFAEYAVYPAGLLFRIPDNVPLRTAVLAEPLACGEHATQLLGDLNGKKIAIIGPGIIGLSSLIAAKAAGASKVLVAGIGRANQEKAKLFGADEYVDIGETDPLEFSSKWTQGEMFDIVYECVGQQTSLDTAVEFRVMQRKS